MVSLTYIFHSCFLLHSEGVANVVFDYWKEGVSTSMAVAGKTQFPKFLSELDSQLPLYVMVSHHHKDHYNQKIFSWATKFPKLTFIVSNDVAKFSRHLLKDRSDTVVLKNHECWKDDNISIKAYPSTDIGNSYVLEVRTSDGRKVTAMHAGDLNNWLWLDESTEEEIRQMDGSFQSALREIATDYPRLDIAMFPVDSRIGRGYENGAKELLRKIAVSRFFPMHFELWQNEEERIKLAYDARAFQLYGNPGFGESIALQTTGDRWASLSGHISSE